MGVLQEFLNYLGEQEDNGSVYVWGRIMRRFPKAGFAGWRPAGAMQTALSRSGNGVRPKGRMRFGRLTALALSYTSSRI